MEALQGNTNTHMPLFPCILASVLHAESKSVYVGRFPLAFGRIVFVHFNQGCALWIDHCIAIQHSYNLL